MTARLNVHPGELLQEEFLREIGITTHQLATGAKLSPRRVLEIVDGRRGITAGIDMRLCGYFGQTRGYWLRVQAAYDRRVDL